METVVSLGKSYLKSEGSTEIGRSEPIFHNYTSDEVSGGWGDLQDLANKRFTTAVKASWQTGAHQIKAGLEYLSNRYRHHWTMSLINQTGPMDFSTYYSSAKGTVGTRNPALFLQDSWRLHSRLVWNYGLRWGAENLYASNGQLWQKITDELQPRLGVVWMADPARQHKISFSYGRFYQDMYVFTPSTFAMADYSSIYTAYDHDPRMDPSGGNATNSSLAVQPRVDGLKGQHQDEWSLGYEASLGGVTVTVNGLYRRLQWAIDEGFSFEYGNFYFGNPGYGLLSAYPKAKRRYQALQIMLRESGDQRLNYFLSYVLSKNYGNYVGVSDQDRGYTTPNSTASFDWPELIANSTGLLPNDRRHVLKGHALYRFAFGLNAGFRFAWQSGTPLSELGAIPQATYWSSFLSPRGSAGRSSSIWDLNLRLAYDLGVVLNTSWQSRLILDLFHIASRREGIDFDQKKYFNVDENGHQVNANPFYGQAIRFQPPMALRLGAEVVF
jgi:hypothetical protein